MVKSTKSPFFLKVPFIMSSFEMSSKALHAALAKTEFEGEFFEAASSEGLTPAMEAIALSSGIDLSEEGIVNWAVDKVKAIVHKFHIFANELWAKVSNANEATRSSIRRAESIGFDHNEKLPVGKATSLLVSAGLAIACVGACVLAVKSIKGAKEGIEQRQRNNRAEELRAQRRERDVKAVARGKRWADQRIAAITASKNAELAKIEAKAKRGEVTLAEIDAFKNKVNSDMRKALDEVEANLKSSKDIRPETVKYIAAARRKASGVVKHTEAEHFIFDTYSKWRGAKQEVRNFKAAKNHTLRAARDYGNRTSALFDKPSNTASRLIHE